MFRDRVGMFRVVGFLLVAASGGCDAGPSRSGGSAEIGSALDAVFDSTFQAAGEEAGVLLRVEGPAPGFVWQRARGIADPGAGSELRPDHTLRIASVTKTYVAAAVLRMAEEGALALDDPIERHLRPSTVRSLREGGYDPAVITVRMLLQHTSGLVDYATEDAFVERVLAEPRHRWSREEQLAVAMEAGDPVAPPGARFHYSDTGYILLGEILEEGAGRPLHAVLRELLSFDALGLEATWLESVEPPPPGAPPRAHQWWAAPEGGTLDTYDWDPSFDLYGGGGLVSNLEDLLDFFRALFEGGVFDDPGSLAAMLSVTPESLGATEGGYGLGLGRARLGGLECFGHGGFWGTLVRYCPEAELGAAGAVTSTADLERLDGLVREALKLMSTRGTGDPDAPVPARTGG